MKLMNLTFIVLAFMTSQARAADSYMPSFEDAPEFLEDSSTETSIVEPAEKWSYQFELLTPDGKIKTLSSKDTSVLLKPASTMKIFTGWWSFKLKNKSDAYIYKMLRRSDNDMAETISQSLGGVFEMEQWYKEQGLPIDETNFDPADGSGLSYDNKANCDIEIKLLRMIRKDKEYNRFKKLLAQPGKDGTLETRLTAYQGKLFAKTGTLKQTAALTGFLETSKGTMLFCVLSDHLKTTVNSARKKIDAMVKKNYGLAVAKKS